EAAGIVRPERRLAARDVQRCALLRSRFREEERSVLELKGRETDLAAGSGPLLRPMKPARDHQMKNQEKIAIEGKEDPLPEASEPDDRFPLALLEGRVDGPQEKRARKSDFLETLTFHPRVEGLEVDDDVRKLGHAPRILSGRRGVPPVTFAIPLPTKD